MWLVKQCNVPLAELQQLVTPSNKMLEATALATQTKSVAERNCLYDILNVELLKCHTRFN